MRSSVSCLANVVVVGVIVVGCQSFPWQEGLQPLMDLSWIRLRNGKGLLRLRVGSYRSHTTHADEEDETTTVGAVGFPPPSNIC